MTTVLVVDDECDIVEAMSALLELEGFRVISACDGDEGLRQLERHRPDVVIVDLMMPKVDGLQLIETVRRADSISKLPIILVSALRPPKTPGGSASGWSAYLRKPFSMDELLSAISRVLGRGTGSSGVGGPEPLPQG